MGLTQILILMQVCRLWNMPLCNHCTPVCTKLLHVSNETLYLFSTNREGTCTSLVGRPWFSHGVFTEKRQKKILKSRPWLTMVWQSFFKTIVNHGWPWFGKAFLNHGQPWSTIGLWNGTSVNHGWQKHCQPWLTMVSKSIVNHGW